MAMAFVPFVQVLISLMAFLFSAGLCTLYILQTLLKLLELHTVVLSYPFLASMFNNFIWFFYSGAVCKTVTPTPPYVISLVSSCLFKLFFEICNIFIYARFSQISWKVKLVAILLPLTVYFTALAIALSTDILLYSTKYLGPVGIATGIIMYASPLIDVAKCWKDKSLQELPTLFCVCGGFFLHGLVWFGAALVATKIDYYLAVASGIVMLLVPIELGLIYKLKLKLFCTVHPEV